jgi:ribosomal protein S18 acetylase RimI-like enzyme
MRIMDFVRKVLAETKIRPLSREEIDAQRAAFARLRPTREQNLRGLGERGESIASFRFRDATLADVPALSELHVVAWNATYPGTHNPPTVSIRDWQWRKYFTTENDGSSFCIVIERPDGALVGFARGNRSDHPDYGGQLSKIYLLPEYYRLGLGRRLMGHVARRFLANGVTSMWLCGEADNPSGSFHEALGGHNLLNDDGTMNYGNYGWRDLRALATICPIE